jgi:hypothetical protein
MLLAEIGLTRQQMCREIVASRRGVALLGALLSTGVALVWLYHVLRASSRGGHRRL